MSLSRILALPVLFLTSTVSAQSGGSGAEVPPSLVPAELVPDTRALSAEEELKSFQVAPGYRVELAASEPLVGDPIFAQFGPDGRLWVVEMRGYMPDIHGNREDEPVGRIVILTDTDGDGGNGVRGETGSGCKKSTNQVLVAFRLTNSLLRGLLEGWLRTSSLLKSRRTRP